MSISPAEFMATTPQGTSGNTAWAQRYARELRGVITRQAASAPRSLQARLGPSELGAACDRQVVGKLVQAARTNHVSDPWPSVVGTAVHAWLAAAFQDDNLREGLLRWLTELAVEPAPGYGGHTDLYDAAEQAVVDHKVLGPTSLAKVKSPSGPSRRYRVQLLLYGLGVRNMGLPVTRIVLAAYPRTASTLDGMYVWSHDCCPDDDVLIAEVLRVTGIRQLIAQQVRDGLMQLRDVPVTPDDDECFYCSFYRPQSAYDGGPGCPGTIVTAAG